MNKNPHKIIELKSFRIFKLHNTDADKGMAIVKVKSLDLALCEKLQKVRSDYIVATSECYCNNTEDINQIAKYSKYFDFNIVSSELMKSNIQSKNSSAKCFILGAGEFLTSPDIFYIENEGKRKIDFITLANSFWKVKNFHKMLEMQKYLKDQGINTTSRIVCGSIKDKDYYQDCKKYIVEHLGDSCKIVLGPTVDELRKLYNSSKFVVHFSSLDSSPRVIFEGLLCGCQCIVSGQWTHSLNKWLDSPLVHLLPKNDYTDMPDILQSPFDYTLNKRCKFHIGLINIFPRLVTFINKEIASTFTGSNIIDQSCVGKITFKSMKNQYTSEIKRLQTQFRLK